MVNISTVKRIAFVYLLIPFLLFAAGWLNTITASLVCLLVFMAMISAWQSESRGKLFFTRSDLLGMIIILGVWIYLSGVGGYTFQNWDHHSRNAVFRDLLDYSWPVVYHFQPSQTIAYGISSDLLMSYYFGFWLPSALLGKFLGWGAANFFLYLWTTLGLLLSVILTASKLKISLTKTTLLLIFFSGMDLLGVLLLQNAPEYSYPHLWPPIQHLEWWAGSLQYSSFTTDLFWTYNQFVPALLIMSLFVTSPDSKSAIFLGGICFFFAPFPALGVAPFLAGGILHEAISFLREKREPASPMIWMTRIASFENLAGLVVGGLSLLFFSTNLAAQSRSFGLPAMAAIYVFFLLFEGGLIWLLLLPTYKKDWMWYLAGVILVLAPWFKIGDSWDFMMRTTISSLYVLLLGIVRFLENRKFSATHLTLILFLFFGAFTPVYEMTRSISRTIHYYEIPHISLFEFDSYFEEPRITGYPFVPELDHINILAADDWFSLSIPRGDGWETKVGNLFNSSFRFLWKENLVYNDS